MGAVAEVGRPARTGVDRGADLVAGRGRVPDRGDDAVGDDRLDVVDRLLVLRRDGDDPDPAPCRCLPAAVLRDVRRPDVAQRMGAARAVLAGDVRALDVDADDRRRDEGIGVAGGVRRPRRTRRMCASDSVQIVTHEAAIPERHIARTIAVDDVGVGIGARSDRGRRSR